MKSVGNQSRKWEDIKNSKFLFGNEKHVDSALNMLTEKLKMLFLILHITINTTYILAVYILKYK